MKFQILLLTLALLVVTEVLGKHQYQASKNEDDQGHIRARRNHKAGHNYPSIPEVVPDEEYGVKAPAIEHHVSHLYHGADVVEKPYVSTHAVHHQVADAYSAAGTNYEHLTPTSATYPQVVQEASIPYEEEIPYVEPAVVDNHEYYSAPVYEEPSKEIMQTNVPVTNYPTFNYPYYPTYYPQIPQYYSPYQTPNPYVPQYQVPYYYPQSQGPIYYPSPSLPQQGLVYPSGAVQGDNSQYSQVYNIPATQYGAHIPNSPYINQQQYSRDLPYYSPPTEEELEDIPE